MSFDHLLITVLAVLNIVSFLLMWNDKRISRRKGDVERVPEGALFFLAIIGGGVGVYVGMLALRHKTRKWYFQIGIPLLILQNLALLYIFVGLW